jgi:hypothetical protein
MTIDILTLQTYKWWRSRKTPQIMFVEYAFDLGVEERWVPMPILQLDHDITPELIELREHRYHRDLKRPSSAPILEVVVRRTVLVRANIVKIL